MGPNLRLSLYLSESEHTVDGHFLLYVHLTMSVYISMAAFKHLIASFESIKGRGGNS